MYLYLLLALNQYCMTFLFLTAHEIVTSSITFNNRSSYTIFDNFLISSIMALFCSHSSCNIYIVSSLHAKALKYSKWLNFFCYFVTALILITVAFFFLEIFILRKYGGVHILRYSVYTSFLFYIINRMDTLCTSCPLIKF